MINIIIELHDGTVFAYHVPSWAAFQAQIQAPVPFVRLIQDNTEVLLSIKAIKLIKKT